LSALSGILLFDKKPVEQKTLHQMADAIGHRGPHGINIWKAGSVGFIHCLLHTTVESKNEKLPFYDSIAQLTITADARIDNREELSDLLHIPKETALTMPDSLFILEAYKKWNTDCPRKLLGDFSFAIWDERNKELFCARDQMGVKPFYYFKNNNIFVFGSELKTFLSLPEVPKLLNDERIIDYLTFGIAEEKSTFYKGIYRLPKGSQIVIPSDFNLTLRTYYALPWPEKRKNNSEDLVGEFYQLLKKSVDCRARTAGHVASFLSGGLDSSAIVALLKENLIDEDKRICTFSAVFEKIKQCDERYYFSDLLNHKQINPYQLNLENCDAPNAFDIFSEYEDEPFIAPHFFMSWNLLDKASRQNINTILDGHLGDEAISYGNGVFVELIRGLRFFSYFKEFYLTFLPSKKKGFSKALRYLFDYYIHIFNHDYKSCVNYLGEREPIWLSVDLQNKLDVNKSTDNNYFANELQIHRNQLNNPLISWSFEMNDKITSQHNIEGRYPYADVPLIEFCLSLPAQIKHNDGYPRYIMRRALKGKLPNKIITRRSKTNFADSMLYAFNKNNCGWLIDSLEEHSVLDGKYINMDELKRKINQLKIDKSVGLRDIGQLLIVLSMKKWLKRF
jgi:asparagine synthase (glutamine-hydrolysing)